jgi:hypothetical protein
VEIIQKTSALEVAVKTMSIKLARLFQMQSNSPSLYEHEFPPDHTQIFYVPPEGNQSIEPADGRHFHARKIAKT